MDVKDVKFFTEGGFEQEGDVWHPIHVGVLYLFIPPFLVVVSSKSISPTWCGLMVPYSAIFSGSD